MLSDAIVITIPQVMQVKAQLIFTNNLMLYDVINISTSNHIYHNINPTLDCFCVVINNNNNNNKQFIADKCTYTCKRNIYLIYT